MEVRDLPAFHTLQKIIVPFYFCLSDKDSNRFYSSSMKNDYYCHLVFPFQIQYLSCLSNLTFTKVKISCAKAECLIFPSDI